MQTFSCQSGSNGNCIFVRAGETRLLIDAGISGVQAQRRMAAHGVDICRVDALLLSHNHVDHTRSAGIFQRKFGLPIHATGGTIKACGSQFGQVHDVRPFASGETLQIGHAVVHTFSTPHDGVDGVCYVIEHRGKRLGILTDLGFVFPQLQDLVADLDAVYIESNYDPDMLARGPYPAWLQERVRGKGGHLANGEAAALLRDFTDGRLQWAALAHLSQHNNTPALALGTSRAALPRPLALHIAGRTGASDLLTL